MRPSFSIPPARRLRAPGNSKQRQSGVVLLIALIVLVAMTLAAVSMMRSVDTGTLVAGNIAFRQSAVQSGDTGVEVARAWLIANQAALNGDIPTAGYYSTRQDNIDFTGNRSASSSDNVDWDNSNATLPAKAFIVPGTGTPPVDGAGNNVAYVINRLCSIPGDPNTAGQSCTTTTISAIGSTQDVADYSGYGLTTKNQIYYRITARIVGLKNTITFVQAVVQV